MSDSIGEMYYVLGIGGMRDVCRLLTYTLDGLKTGNAEWGAWARPRIPLLLASSESDLRNAKRLL